VFVWVSADSSDEKRQLQLEFDSEVERLQAKLACVTLERNQAVQ